MRKIFNISSTKLFNVVLVLLLSVMVILIIIKLLSIEKFTNDEMKAYPKMLKENCKYSKNIYNKLKNKNKKCNIKNTNGKITGRDTINNKRICYDDTGKEIVSYMDTDSYCNIDKLVNNLDSTKSNSTKSNSTKSNSTKSNSTKSNSTKSNSTKSNSTKSNSTKSNSTKSNSTKSNSTKSNSTKSNKDNSSNLNIGEGPDFINSFYIPPNQSFKSSSYATITNEPIGYINKYSASSPYDNINFSSDPAFIERLSKFNKNQKNM